MANSFRRRGFTLIELLVAIAIIGILMGLLLGAVQKVRAAAARADCQNRLKQLALALHNRHAAFGVLPPGHRSGSNPQKQAFSGWTLDILPELEQGAVYDAGTLAYRQLPTPFLSPPHTPLTTVVAAFACPTDPRVREAQFSIPDGVRAALTSYLGVSGTDSPTRLGVLFSDSKVRLTDVTDGTSNTLMIGERPPSHDFRLGWWYAGLGQDGKGAAELILGVRERNQLVPSFGSSCGPGPYGFTPAPLGFADPCGTFHFWSPHTGGANFAFCDGSVRFLRYDADAVLPALATRAGGEVVNLD